MGEANRKRQEILDRLKKEQPYCIFCGGQTLGTTVDHVPPIAIFNNRDRPKGMEFLACAGCNSGSRPDDQIAALISRLYPDASSDAQKKEISKIISGVKNNNPDLISEIMPSRRQTRRARKIMGDGDLDILNAQGPLLNNSILRFGAKLGLAMHRKTTSRTVPNIGAISVSWFTNHDRIIGRFPDSITQYLGDPQTLRQGKKVVGDQFEIASAVPQDNPEMSVHLAKFRLSFAILIFAVEDHRQLHDEAPNIFRPGFLLGGREGEAIMRSPKLTWQQ